MVVCWKGRKFLFFFVTKYLHLIFYIFHLLLFLLLSRRPALINSASRQQRALTYPEILIFLTVKSSLSPGNTAARAGWAPADGAGKVTHWEEIPSTKKERKPFFSYKPLTSLFLPYASVEPECMWSCCTSVSEAAACKLCGRGGTPLFLGGSRVRDDGPLSPQSGPELGVLESH